MNALPSQPATLHLVGVPGTDRPTIYDHGRLAPPLLLAAALRHGLTPRGPVVIVGPAGATAAAESCGLTPDERIAPPIGEPWLARPSLRRHARRLDRLVCWSDELAPLARRMAPEVHLISTRPGRCLLGPRQFARVLTVAEHDAIAWRIRGGSPEVAPDWIDALREPTDAPRAPSVRAATGIGHSPLLIAALTDHPGMTDARGLAFLLSVLHTTGYPVCGLVPSISANAHAARRHIRGLVSRYPLLVTERPIIDHLHEIDVVTMPEEDKTGASMILEAVATARGCRVIRLSHRGKAGLKSTPGEVAPILETLDAIMADRPDPAHQAPSDAEPAHA
ncbi:MAG: hypothetical protein LAT64_03885 [Phycisphaerales bacterium]|nr:hypothetical protein [Planctomycetota bacterium]MCH8507892.1 hypothetical protein [Phycisphaerales bacterium]